MIWEAVNPWGNFRIGHMVKAFILIFCDTSTYLVGATMNGNLHAFDYFLVDNHFHYNSYCSHTLQLELFLRYSFIYSFIQ